MKNLVILLSFCFLSTSVFAFGKSAGGDNQGIVKETMDAGGYTYSLLDVKGKDIWVAGPTAKIKKGDKVNYTTDMPMSNFKSKALNKTFDTLYFIENYGPKTAVKSDSTWSAKKDSKGTQKKGEEKKDKGGMPDFHKGMDMSTGGGQSAGHTSAPKVELKKIEKAKGGHTVEECFKNKSKLNKKKVLIRGQVVKFSPRIMGKNWIHLQDGTGKEGTNDVTVTSKADVKVGDVILIEGTLAKDKDLGAGYFYPVLIEDAVLK